MFTSEEIAQSLLTLDTFRGLSLELVQACAALWSYRELATGETLWWQGELGESLGFVINGELVAHLAGKEVGKLHRGEPVGESAAFFRDRRTASISATRRSELLITSHSDLLRMRSSFQVIYDRLLEHALLSMAKRVHAVDRHIAQLATGSRPAAVRKEESSWDRLLKRVASSFDGSPPPVDSALRKLPILQVASKEVVDTIASAMKPVRVGAGEPVFLEGESGDSVFIVADGCIEVVRAVKARKGQRLAELFPGALFGTGSLLLRERRNASCLALETAPSWVYEMNRAAFNALKDEAGRRWREVLLGAVWFQLSRADEQLVAIQQGGARVERSDYERIRAGLCGIQAGDELPHLWKVEMS